MRRASMLAVLSWICIPGLSLAAETAAQGPKPGLAPWLKPCTTIPGLPPEARCGLYEVWENRTAKAGRKIPLRVVVIPASGPDRLPDALTLFGGGPGESNVSAAPEALEIFGRLRERRDILLVDFRGTGGPAGLLCPEMQGSAGAQGMLDSYYPPDKVNLTGAYKDPENGRKVRIETAGHRLQVLEGEYPPLVLVALSPTRFRLEGMPPSPSYLVEFRITDGGATVCTLPWTPEQPLVRQSS